MKMPTCLNTALLWLLLLFPSNAMHCMEKQPVATSSSSERRPLETPEQRTKRLTKLRARIMAEQHDPCALLTLGTICEEEEHYEDAAIWYHLASKAGSPLAAQWLQSLHDRNLIKKATYQTASFARLPAVRTSPPPINPAFLNHAHSQSPRSTRWRIFCGLLPH